MIPSGTGSDPPSEQQANRTRRTSLGITVAIVILLAMVLRTVHYMANPSMWYDELAVARNITDRNLVGLLSEPLDHLQVAPAGFLLATKVSTMLFGENEYALRLMPWAFGMMTPVFFWLIARRFVTGVVLIGGLLLIAVSPALIWYGGNVKQYSSDITIAMILVWLALRYREHSRGTWSAVVAGLVGGLLITCSQPAVVTAFLLCTMLATEMLLSRPKRQLLAFMWLAAGWGLGALAATVFALHTVDPATMEHMRDFWAGGFPSTESPIGFLTWYPLQIAQTFGVFLFFIASAIPPLKQIAVTLAVLAVPGFVYLLQRDRWRAALLLTPLIGALIMATFQLLPFRHRVGLHATWPILVFALASFAALRARFPRGGRFLIPVALVVLIGLPSAAILATGGPPYRGHQEMRPILEEFAAYRRPEDAVYVFHGARHAMYFYGPAYGVEPDEWTEGGEHYGDNRAYLREIDAFRGTSRVWFIYTQMLSYKAPKDIISYLEEIGVRLELLRDPFGSDGQGDAAAYLFDLSDPERLQRASADSFPLVTKQSG